ncbi:uncharacterized protein LOC119070277 isoform X2 [Bradysia coprophila]|uniref:uncharacterized protein LOC119070277 isoform X2 n=1 Tax=Bradysia coprophila TaxID=38358 RepID=UPI00187D97FB|nr:uncharacterized protein LOC119070277 isoform X2 [Bradysia coprophila]
MKKFVVIKNTKVSTNNPDAHNQFTTQVKMSGYLKKKRNKMGGWRKLWFVLQNQLLLSYSSKEDYEKKLAPFKDVVSLVPGTTIRPTKGPRFIIETTTNLMLTYRCDDNKTCSEWISALVDSLASSSQITLENKLANQKKALMASRSWDSICRLQGSRSPNIPIVNSTAKICKRNGLQANANEKRGQIDSKCERVQNFRLHRNDQPAYQSYEVHRINSMFNRCSDANDDDTKLKRFPFSTGNNNGNSHPLYTHRQQEYFQNCSGIKDTSGNSMTTYENCSIEEQIQRISLEDEQFYSYPTSINDENCPSTSNDEKKLLDANLHDNKKMPLSSSASSPCTSGNVNSLSEPIYAVVDLKDKYARRKMREMENENAINSQPERPRSFHVGSSDYEEVLYLKRAEGNEDEGENIYEPINIPEFSHKNPMWRYFSKINIDALVEITKWKKEKDDGTTFSDIRKRWGNHRKSIKNRMKKFYSKEPTVKTVTNGNCCSDDDLGSQAASCSTSTSLRSSEDSPEKQPNTANSFDVTDGGDGRKHRTKGERNLFGSLGRLRKSRTSLFLDDVAPRKKILITYGSDFQTELKSEVVRRCSDEAKVGERHVPW